MVKETNVAIKKVVDHRIGFKIIPLFVMKIVLADTGYIEVQNTKIKSALENRSSARVTARKPAVRRQGRASVGRSPYTGTIIWVRAQLAYYCYVRASLTGSTLVVLWLKEKFGLFIDFGF